ncbi:MAG: hypothetical protein K0S43_3865 [Cellulosimicrobium sp.]|nr:hypothetical protein [Cellulosimicrobium sp.]
MVDAHGSTSPNHGSTSATQDYLAQTGLAPVRGDGPGRDGCATRAAGQPQVAASYCSVTVVDLPSASVATTVTSPASTDVARDANDW